MKLRKIYLAAAVSAVLVLLVSGGIVWAQEKAPKTLLIGYLGAMSGPASFWGQVHERGPDLAIDDINAKGGIKVAGETYRLALKSYDHAFDPSRSVEIVRRMVGLDKVAFIINQGTTTCKPNIPYTEENKIIHMGAITGRDIMVFMKENYTYRYNVSSPEVQLLLWEWITKNRPGWKTTVHMEPDDASGWDTLKDAKELVYAKYGIKLVAETFYRRGITDFYPILIRFLAAKPDVFDLGIMPAPDAGRIIKQARELGYKGPFVHPTSGTYAPLLEIAGSSAEGLIFGAAIDPNSSFATAEEKDFYVRWMKKYGPPYDFWGVMVGIPVYCVAQAMEKANSLDSEKVTKVLQTAEFNVLGRKIKAGGESVFGPPPRCLWAPWGMYEVKNGKPEMIQMLTLPTGY